MKVRLIMGQHILVVLSTMSNNIKRRKQQTNVQLDWDNNLEAKDVGMLSD